MFCEEKSCGRETSRIVLKNDKWVCPPCGDSHFQPLAGAHNIQISKRKYGISMTRAEVGRIRTNKRQPDGTYSPHWRYRGE